MIETQTTSLRVSFDILIQVTPADLYTVIFSPEGLEEAKQKGSAAGLLALIFYQPNQDDLPE